MKDLVLCESGDKIFVKLGKAYLLYMCEKEILQKLTAPQIVGLVEQVIQEHQRHSIN